MCRDRTAADYQASAQMAFPGQTPAVDVRWTTTECRGRRDVHGGLSAPLNANIMGENGVGTIPTRAGPTIDGNRGGGDTARQRSLNGLDGPI